MEKMPFVLIEQNEKCFGSHLSLVPISLWFLTFVRHFYRDIILQMSNEIIDGVHMKNSFALNE